jgi:uncharacterized protein YfaS (alpha-2-macroglobulin family)
MKKLLALPVLHFTLCFFLLLLYTFSSTNSYCQDSRVNTEKYKNYSPDFTIRSPLYYYLPGDTVRIILESNDIKTVSEFNVKVYRITEPEKFITLQAGDYSFSVIGKDSSNMLSLFEERLSFTKKVYPGLLKKKNTYINDFVKFLPGEKGVYLVRIFLKEKVVTCGFIVTSLAIVTRITQSSILNYTSGRITSEPVEGVKLSLFINSQKYGEITPAGSVSNTEFGGLSRELRTQLLNSRHLIIAQKDGETAVSDPQLYFSGGIQNYTSYIITSQPVYRPPAKVDFKISTRSNTAGGYGAYAGGNVIVYIKDSKGSNIFRKLVKTDEFGSFSDSVNIMAGAPLGDYFITAQVLAPEDTSGVNNNESAGESFSQVFGVEEYKKPEYKVEAKTDKEQYGGKDKIEIEVQSDYYFGSPVQDGEVSYSIFKKTLYRPWWYYSEYRWWYDSYFSEAGKNNDYYNSENIYYGKGKLDEKGNFKTTYTINEDFKEGKGKSAYETDYQYIITAYVTDKTRRKVLDVKTVNVTRSDYFINSHASRYVVKPGEKIGVEVKARDFSDKPVEANFTVSVNRITHEKDSTGAYKQITNFVSSYSGKTFLTGDEVVFVDTEAEGYYDIEVTSFDSRGTKISSKTGSYVSSGRFSWWNKDEGTIEIIPEKDSYSPGDTMTALVSIGHENMHLLVTNYNGNIVSYWIEKIDGSSAYIKIPVTEGCAPNFFFSVSYVKDGNFYSRSQSVAVIPVNKFLNIEISSDKPVYKPREDGTINILVKDNLGNPVKNSEVTVGIIDESIYAIREETVKDIRAVFYSPVKDNSVTMFNHSHNYSYSLRSSHRSLFEMYDYRTNSDIARVTGVLYDNLGNPLYNARVIVNGRFLAAVTDGKGNFSFIIPEGEYGLTLALGEYNVPGNVRAGFRKDEENTLKIKSSLKGIMFATVNDREVFSVESVVSEYTALDGVISGTVMDAVEKTPIVGAIVKIQGINHGAETDENGYFQINNVPNGTYNIIASAVLLGYGSSILKGIVLTTGKGVNLTLQLSETGGVTTDMLEVIAERKGIDVEQSGRNIGTEQIDYSGIRGIQNIVSKTSGVIQTGDATIYIRGGRSSENLIIVDGVATYSPTEEFTEEEPVQYVEAVARNDFRDAIFWQPSVHTDENGIAQVKIKFPDNLTTWRVTARAITNRTDVGQNSFTAVSRKDLIIRVETPRFFQQNDEVVVSTIVHNYLDEEKKTKVSLRLNNLMLAGTSPYEQEILLGRNEEKRIDWTVKVLNPAGIGNVYASALTNEESDAMERDIPIQPYGLKISQYSAHDLSGSSVITETFEIPEGTDTRSSYLEIGLSPSLVSSILGSLEFLIGYPYGCIEQTMSRFMPTVIAANTLKEIGAPEDPFFAIQVPKMVQKGMDKVYSMQNNDGGWGWWKNSGSDPYMSAYVLYSLKLAKENGYDVKKENFNNAVTFIKASLSNKKLDLATRAFITYIISQGDSSLIMLAGRQFKYFEKKEATPLVKAWLSLAAGNLGRSETQRKYITDVMRESNPTESGGIYWGGKIKRYEWKNDHIISTAMVIKALLAEPLSVVENKEMTGQAVSWLLEQKRGGSWGNTQQNAFIVYALADYIKKNNELEPDYMLKVFVNDSIMAERHIVKDDIFRIEDRFIVPGAKLKQGENRIRFEKSGSGRSYLTTMLTYFESERNKYGKHTGIEETDNGFEIERSYYRLIKTRNEKTGVYTYKKSAIENNDQSVITSGDELMVKIKITPAQNNNNYFMLEDPIPAGCEYIQEDWAFAIEGENNYQGKSQNTWNWWYADKDVRDSRIVFFASNLGAQEYEFSYLLRAQIPGTYNIMPSRGTLMYYPEVNGSGENLVLKIIDK